MIGCTSPGGQTVTIENRTAQDVTVVGFGVQGQWVSVPSCGEATADLGPSTKAQLPVGDPVVWVDVPHDPEGGPHQVSVVLTSSGILVGGGPRPAWPTLPPCVGPAPSTSLPPQ